MLSYRQKINVDVYGGRVVRKLSPEIDSVSRDGKATVQFYEGMLLPVNKSIPIETLEVTLIRDPATPLPPILVTVLSARYLSLSTFEVQLQFSNPLSISNPVIITQESFNFFNRTLTISRSKFWKVCTSRASRDPI